MQQRRSKSKYFIMLFIVLIAGSAFLWMKDIPAPAQPVDQALPADRFLHSTP